MIKLQPGDYVSTEGMTEEQYHAVCKAFMDAGARETTPYGYGYANTVVWDARDNSVWQSELFESSFGKGSDPAAKRELTIDQILGSDNTEGAKQ